MTEFSIYQINVDRDTANVCFIGMESLEKIKGTKEVNAAAFDRVYDGIMDCISLENFFLLFFVDFMTANLTATHTKTTIRSSMLTILPTTKDALFPCRM